MASEILLHIFVAVISFVVVRYLFNKNGQPINWPILGMLPDTLVHLSRIHERFTEVLERSGHTFLYQGTWFSNVKVLATVDPANVHYIMSSNFSNFPKGSKFSKIFDVLGRGIFNSDSERWMNQRKLAQALFNHRRFHQFLNKTSRDMVEKGLVTVLEHVAERGLVVDMQDLFQRFTFDITCKLIIGYNPRCLSIDFPEVEFSKAMDDAEETLFWRHITPEWFWKSQRKLKIGQEWKMERAWKTLDRISAEYISRKRKQLNNQSLSPDDGSEGVDLLTSYMKDAEIMGSKPDDKFLRDTIMNMVLAGKDTTSSALTWFFWLISKNPQVESKIREELKASVPVNQAENWRLFNPQELNSLVYLHGALCESLRLYPPVPFQHKAPLQEDVLPSGHQVNSEMKIVLCLYAMGRMKSIWGEDCLKFKPERWITEGGKVTCLGKEVAFTQMKTVVAAVIHNYHVQAVEGHPVSPNVSIILQMKHGFKVRISRRWV
ncbi:hypothetical protein P3X46_018410 [Hevea brasiliensis]|uniref:Cytochrome P450 n=1 Tax=Hevea brasiliensis TaxID=3981 RepID=A0ABQ9LTS2_HEVBR|nr:hypothetical protein P3X46_018410 [Hevea brasiliensis]